MSTYQLSCGEWKSDAGAYEIGGVYQCCRHGAVTIVGKTGTFTEAAS